MGKKINIICRVHGEFTQSADSHVNNKCGCPKCSGNAKSNSLDFINKSVAIHGCKYSYEFTEYKNATSKVTITCSIHGNFQQTAGDHLGGKGCFKCAHALIGAKSRKKLSEFIAESNVAHDYKYDYSKSVYTRAFDKIIITCPVHGDFLQNPICHSTGKGCPRCYKNISKAEVNWLNSLGIVEEYRQHTLLIDGKKFKVDAYDPITNTIYEFWGDFWHGNPRKFPSDGINWANRKTFGELYSKTTMRIEIMKSAGFNLIDIWECDFNMKGTSNGK